MSFAVSSDQFFGESPMRALLFCLLGLMTASSDLALAQMKLSPKAAPGANETRYFTSIDGLMDGNADAILKETRQGKTVTSAVLDVCYPAEKGSDRKDRFVVNLAVNGQTLSGTTQSISDQLPVTVKLVRKPTGDTFEFKGQISVGQTVTEVTSTDNSDLSEKEFRDNQTTDDGIAAAPKDFSEVSPESIGVRLKLDAALDFLQGLKGQDVEVSLSSLTVSCDALRAGEQTINISVDPNRAAGLIAKFKSLPGVVAAGWTSGIVEMERSIRFASADWREADRLDRDKLAAAIANVLGKTLSAKSSSSAWNPNTGRLKLTLAIADRKSTRLNSSHGYISYAVFCLKKKKTNSICRFLNPSILAFRYRCYSRGCQPIHVAEVVAYLPSLRSRPTRCSFAPSPTCFSDM